MSDLEKAAKLRAEIPSYTEYHEYDPSKTTRFENVTREPVVINGQNLVKLKIVGKPEYTAKIVSPDAPPMPLDGTPAQMDWNRKYSRGDNGKLWYSSPIKPADQAVAESVQSTMKRLETAKASPKPAAFREEAKDVITSANEAATRKAEWDKTKELGVRDQGYNETSQEYSDYIESLQKDDNGPFGKNGNDGCQHAALAAHRGFCPELHCPHHAGRDFA